MATEAPLTLPPEVEAILESAAASRGLHNAKFDYEAGSGARDGFTSTVHRVRISDKAQPAGRELSVICKTARPIFGSLMTRMYEIEAFMYETVLPAMQQVAHLAEPLPWPTYVAASVRGPPPLVMAVEDLRPEGFAMADRRQRMDAAHCRLALRQLARLHGAGLALQHRRPPAFAAIKEALRDNVWAAPELRNNMRSMNKAVQVVPDLLADRFPVGGEEHARLQSLFAALVQDSVALTGPTSGRGYTIIHNDLHINNMMFQYDKAAAERAERAEPTGCRLIDFQMAMYGNPALDLVTVLLVCTDKATRDASWAALLRGYHDEVRATLAAAGCPEALFPWALLQELLCAAAGYGLCMAPVYHYGLFADDAAVAEMKEAMAQMSAGAEVAMPMRVSPELKERLAGLVQDVADWGWLPPAADTQRRLADAAAGAPRYTERRILGELLASKPTNRTECPPSARTG